MASQSPSPTPQPQASDDAPQDNQKIETGLRKHAREDDTTEEHGNKAIKTFHGRVEINVILRTSLGGEGRRLAHWLRSVEPRMLHHFKSIRIADVIQDQTVLQTGRSARSRIIDLARRHCYGNDMLRLAKRNRLHCPQFEDEQHIAASCPTTYRFTHFVRLLVQRPFDVVLEDEDKTAGYYQHRIVFPKPLED
ncbi:uncharacterized protein MYCGRDRAFT_92877 [Zymoseptoria tritici IPO323]|uniref:Uncharacterized protein n=1 Tax=Zymoseptoria tritici (strain CBS 115943 / IPO323) TaxID=336722 RepID=F9X978_ZYMTI|nr:uncharacterized protein MYCGRDRAFT_92877 [Zymoseptoria tritici IPO323]EGP88138.1 hypothetical protein MYCGRDRAFT_92877 [Zymoseptoria tritici IPO323]